jgi:hypothetical protein
LTPRSQERATTSGQESLSSREALHPKLPTRGGEGSDPEPGGDITENHATAADARAPCAIQSAAARSPSALADRESVDRGRASFGAGAFISQSQLPARRRGPAGWDGASRSEQQDRTSGPRARIATQQQLRPARPWSTDLVSHPAARTAGWIAKNTPIRSARRRLANGVFVRWVMGSGEALPPYRLSVDLRQRRKRSSVQPSNRIAPPGSRYTINIVPPSTVGT